MEDNINNQMLTWIITISGQLDQISRQLAELQDSHKIMSGNFDNKITKVYGNTLGERLTYCMKFRDMQGIELSKRTGLTVSSISRYRHDKGTPRPWHLQNIADALLVDINLLLGNDVINEVEEDGKDQ